MTNQTISANRDAVGMQEEFEQLQRNAVRLSLPALFIAAIIYGQIGTRATENSWGLTVALGLLVMIGLIWLVSQLSFLGASLLLIGTVFASIAAAVVIGKIGAAVVLLGLPVGLTCLMLGLPAGVFTAAGLSLVLFAPFISEITIPDLQTVTLLVIWGTVGLIGLILRPLLTAVDWSWRSVRHSQELVVQAQAMQIQLSQALEDLQNANTQLTRLNGLANNLRKVAEDERRIKEQFVANVSHELRTPLNMIIGFSEMILKAPETYGQKIPAHLLADLQVVLRNSQHLSSLIDDVLDLSQIEAGQMALVKEWVQISEILEAVSIAVRPLFESKHLSFVPQVEEALPEIFCDRTRVREVLLNLLSNAGRFTEQGGVTLRVWREGGMVQFSVADTGPGIGEEDRKLLFQPFQQLDSTIRRKHGGTGLGLSISKSFVELHGGKMWVESIKGSGTTFYFSLPQDQEETPSSGYARWFNPFFTFDRPARQTTHALVDSRPHVMVVEDGSVLQRLLRRYLNGVEVSAVKDFDEARQELERSPARVVFVNRMQSASNGIDLALPSHFPENTPAIFCSIEDPLEYAPSIDVSEALVKPISRENLLGALQKQNKPVQNILLVEDEPDAQKLFVRMLTGAGKGYRVLRAANGRHALNLLKRQTVDLIFLDLVMPEMDGFTFLKFKAEDERLREIPVILISAKDPHGQPVVSNYVAAARSEGLSVQQLLDCIQALTNVLAPIQPGRSNQVEE